jgi:hypothetical protein
MNFASGTFASGAAVVLLWMFGPYGGLLWWVFLLTLAILAGWIWAALMWFAVGERYSKTKHRRVDEGTGK